MAGSSWRPSGFSGRALRTAERATWFRSWGVHRTDDFGEIVFQLVERGLLTKTEEDSKDDFRDVYAFEDAFRPDDYWEEVLQSSS